MHPVAIYSKSNENKLIETSICFISDDLNHDVCLVYQILSDTVKFVKQDMNPNVSMIHYFSDGCAGQYKNCKKFIVHGFFLQRAMVSHQVMLLAVQ